MIILGLLGLLNGCGERAMEGMIILTRAKESGPQTADETTSSWPYYPESSIVVVNPDDADAPAFMLSEGFYSACGATLSYDAERIVFAGQSNKGDIWQIWEMDLSKLEARQVTSSRENCIDPAFLPDGRILFSKETRDVTGNKEHALFTCNIDGSELNQITFNPNDYFASHVLMDGRVLAVSKERFPTEKQAILMVLRPDGTKAELFYQGEVETRLASSGVETMQGKILMIETRIKDQKAGKLLTIDYNRPMKSREELSKNIQGSFKSAAPLDQNRLMVSYKAPKDQTYGLYAFDENAQSLGEPLYKDSKFNVVEALVVEKRERPRKIPSEVNMNHDSGLLMCQDINFTGYHHEVNNEEMAKAVQIEFLGMEASLGRVDVEKDGSVYLKIAADTPFQIQTLDENGNIVQGPGSWIYIRPNERRGCVGCHQGNDMVPENRQPLSVLKEPVIIPQPKKLLVESKVESEKK